MKLFCELPKDQKTYWILKKYIEDIEKGIDIFSEDCKIQKIEIEAHIYLTGEDGVKWIEKYAEGERRYLNTIKELAVVFECTDREINWDNFCFFADKINKYKNCLLERIGT